VKKSKNAKIGGFFQSFNAIQVLRQDYEIRTGSTVHLFFTFSLICWADWCLRCVV